MDLKNFGYGIEEKTLFKMCEISQYLRKFPFRDSSWCFFWIFAISHVVSKKLVFVCLKRYGAYTCLVYQSGYSPGGREMRRRHPRSISIGDDSSSWKLYTQSYSTGSFPWTCSDWFRPEWSAEENYQSISTGNINPSFGFILQNNSDFSKTTFYNFDQ